jgi:hypothetical protein
VIEESPPGLAEDVILQAILLKKTFLIIKAALHTESDLRQPSTLVCEAPSGWGGDY